MPRSVDAFGFDALKALDLVISRTVQMGMDNPKAYKVSVVNGWVKLQSYWKAFRDSWTDEEIEDEKAHYNDRTRVLLITVPTENDEEVAYCAVVHPVFKSRGGWTNRREFEWGVTVYDDYPLSGEIVLNTRIREEDVKRVQEGK